MKGISDTVAADIIGEREMGRNTSSRTSPTHDEIAQLAFSLYEARGDKTDTTLKIGCVRNRNLCGTTPNSDVPPKHTTH